MTKIPEITSVVSAITTAAVAPIIATTLNETKEIHPITRLAIQQLANIAVNNGLKLILNKIGAKLIQQTATVIGDNDLATLEKINQLEKLKDEITKNPHSFLSFMEAMDQTLLKEIGFGDFAEIIQSEKKEFNKLSIPEKCKIIYNKFKPYLEEGCLAGKDILAWLKDPLGIQDIFSNSLDLLPEDSSVNSDIQNLPEKYKLLKPILSNLTLSFLIGFVSKQVLQHGIQNLSNTNLVAGEKVMNIILKDIIGIFSEIKKEFPLQRAIIDKVSDEMCKLYSHLGENDIFYDVIEEQNDKFYDTFDGENDINDATSKTDYASESESEPDPEQGIEPEPEPSPTSKTSDFDHKDDAIENIQKLISEGSSVIFNVNDKNQDIPIYPKYKPENSDKKQDNQNKPNKS